MIEFSKACVHDFSAKDDKDALLMPYYDTSDPRYFDKGKKKMAEDKNEHFYASDGAKTWIELLRKTALFDKKTGKSLLSQTQRNFRKEREDSKQTDIFHTPILDMPCKDDYGLMDINPFGLGKRPRFSTITYDLNDSKITVTGSGEYGLATIFDYDIVIFMVSHLVRQMNKLKNDVERGVKNPKLPPRIMHVNVSDLFKYIEIEDGGYQHKALLSKLQRLKGTLVEIEKNLDKSTRRVGSLSLIGDYAIISKTKTGNISSFELEVPRWIYDGVVRQGDPTVLTLCDEYMLIKNGYHKFLARIARKSAGEDSWDWNIRHLYERSGTPQTLKDFQRDIKKSIDDLKEDPIKEYTIIYKETGKGRKKDLDIYISKTVVDPIKK